MLCTYVHIKITSDEIQSSKQMERSDFLIVGIFSTGESVPSKERGNVQEKVGTLKWLSLCYVHFLFYMNECDSLPLRPFGGK